MKSWQKVVPAVWPVVGAFILLALMAIATWLAWRTKESSPQVSQHQSDSEKRTSDGQKEEGDSQGADNTQLVSPAKLSGKPADSRDLPQGDKQTRPTGKPKPNRPMAGQPHPAPQVENNQQQPALLKDPAKTRSVLAVVHNNYQLGLDGYCPVTLVSKKRWKKGEYRWRAHHQGRTFFFTSLEQQKIFLSDPDRYSPIASGNDVVVEREEGRLIPGLRGHGVFYQRRIYLFASETSLKTFLENPERYVDRSDLAQVRPSIPLEAVNGSAGYMILDQQYPYGGVAEDDCCQPCCRRRLFGRWRCR